MTTNGLHIANRALCIDDANDRSFVAINDIVDLGNSKKQEKQIIINNLKLTCRL